MGAPRAGPGAEAGDSGQELVGTAARKTACPKNTIAGREQLLAEPFGDH